MAFLGFAPGGRVSEQSSVGSQSSEVRVPPAVFGVVALALIVRLVQLSSAMVSPLTYQPGPDEDYYRRFAEAVAAGGGGGDNPEVSFLGPAVRAKPGAPLHPVPPEPLLVAPLSGLRGSEPACVEL